VVGVTDPHSIYNKLIDMMCSHCNTSIFRKCKDQSEHIRCKTMIHCMERIMKRDDEEYPVKLPKVKE